MENKSNITIVDSQMGFGKTYTAMQEIKNNPDKKYIIVTPYLSEVGRIQEGVGKILQEGDSQKKVTTFHKTKGESTEIEITDIDGNKVHRPWRLLEPCQKGLGKLESLKELLEKGKSIVTTHALMGLFDYQVQSLLNIGDYHFILDEVIEVVSEYKWSSVSDRDTFFNHFGHIDDEGYLVWDEQKNNPATYDGRFNDLLTLCLNRNLVQIDNSSKVLMWEFPVSIFRIFESVTLLTFMFEGSYLKAYFDSFNVEYNYMSVKDGKFVKFIGVTAEDKARIKALITIEDSPALNKIGELHYSLSASWYKKNIGTTSKENVSSKKLKDNTYNFFKHKTKTQSAQNLWSTFSPYKHKIKGLGYSKGFLSFNTRATNEYRHKESLAYLVNVYPHTSVTRYFNSRKIMINEQAFALSSLLQWVWRSQIRDARPIRLYIPSKRMRELLIDFLT